MGNGILSRSGSGDGAKIGDIRLTTRDSIGAKWALCNGDSVPSGSPIASFCAFDPTSASNWYDLSTVVTQVPNIVLYDPSDNVYWGIYIAASSSSFSSTPLQIYRYDRDERGQYQSVVFSTNIAAGNSIYDACFVHDEEYGNKIAFVYKNTNYEEYIIFYDINSNTCTFADTSANIFLGKWRSLFESYGYDRTSITNGGNQLTIAAAGRFVVIYCYDYEQFVVYDSRTNLEVHSLDFADFDISIIGYASGPRHTVILYNETEENCTYALIVDNNTGEIDNHLVCSADISISGSSVSCIYEESENCEYFVWWVHSDTTSCYRGCLKITSSGSVTDENVNNAMTVSIFGSYSVTFGSYYEFKLNNTYYALLMNSSAPNDHEICELNGKAMGISSKSIITLGDIYSADRNIFGYKTGAPWYLLSNGYSKDIYFTIPCLPIIGEGSYNGFIKVEN